MASIDFPSSPTLNQTYSANGKTWKWNGNSWAVIISPVGAIAVTPASKNSSFTFSFSEANTTTVVDSSSAVEGLIPTNASVAYPLGTKLRMYRKGTGTVKFVPDTGVTLNLPTGIKPKRYMGAAAYKSVDEVVNGTNIIYLTYDSEYRDSDGFHSNSVNTDRMTIPSGLGIRKVTLQGQTGINSITSNVWRYSSFATNNAFGAEAASSTMVNTTGTTIGHGQVSVNVPCTDGDWFSVLWQNQSDTSINILAGSCFKIDVVEIDAQGFVAFQYGAVEIEKIGTDEWIVTDHSALG